ncbi:MAG: tryptophan synthase subunit alpha [Candidatus Omnitrophica bacterium]|nr:tryptophan synthase subunit alpha [Candidatus Omnitrophota bacterium]
MNRIDKKFKGLRRDKKKALLAFITAGDPSLSTTKELALEFDRAGVDVLELGVPFSDPLADGPTIQAASQRALKRGVNARAVFKLVEEIRRKSEIPIALLTYYNIIYHFGLESFVKKAVSCGVDGVIVPDLPVEESKEMVLKCKKYGLATIFLVAPTSDARRIKEISERSRGFIYYVSVTGITGARRSLPAELINKVRQIKRITSKPVCVGFGVSNPKQAAGVAKVADGVIVGSAIIKVIEKRMGRKDLVPKTVNFVRRLRQAV